METQNREIKESWNIKFLNTLCAFSNTEGGIMIIGIADNNEVIGVKDPQYLLKVIPDDIRNKLDIAASVVTIIENDKTCIKITVEKGDRYVDLDGVFYKRVGNTTQKVKGNELESWVLSNMRMTWADLPVKDIKIGDLSQEAIDFFVKTGIESKRISPEAAKQDNVSLLERYKLMDDKGLRNSAAILFLENPRFSYPPAVVRIGAFTENGKFLRHDLIDCAVVLQPDRALKVMLDQYILGKDELKGAMLVRGYPYPERALREALINAIIHRDYSGKIATYVRVYPDRVKISNPGSLPKGWTAEDLFKDHRSEPANPTIADVFHDMGFIEQWGSGIETIRDECKAKGIPEPEYEVVDDGIEVTFRLPEKKNEDSSEKVIIDLSDLTDTEAKIYAIVYEGNISTTAEMSEITGIPLRTAERAVANLVEKGFVKRTGGKRYGKWVVISKSN